MASNVSWGIEIGAGAIKAVKVARDGDDVNLLDYAVVPHRRPLSDPDVDPTDVMRVSLGQFAANVDLRGTVVGVAMPGHAGLTRFTKLPPIENKKKKIDSLAKFEAGQQIPFPLEDVEWGYQPFVNEDSPEVELGIFAIPREQISRQLDQLDELGIHPDAIMLSPVAVFNAMAFDLQFSEDMPGTILLDVGTTSTDLIIAQGGGVWVRTFHLGGHNFTEALVDAFKLSYAKAEKLKREAEQSKHARHVLGAMRPVFANLVQEVQRSISFYQGIHPNAELKRLIGLGSTFQLPGLRKFLKQQLQMDVYRMERFKRMSLDGPRSGEFETATGNLATAYGMALQGLDLDTIQVNLMPVGVTRQAMWKKKTPWFAGAAALGLLACGAAFVRPIMDQAAIDSARKPAAIAQAVNQFNTLRNEAEEAGAIGDADIDQSVASMISLAADKPDVFVPLLDDVGALIAFAQERAGDPAVPVFSLDRVDTAYLAESAGGGASRAPARRGRSRRGGDEEAPANAVVTLESLATDKPRMLVEVSLTARHPDPARFVVEAIEPFFAQHAVRQGLDHYIVYSPTPEQLYRLGGGAEQGGPGGREGDRRGQGRDGDRNPPPPSGRASGLDEQAPLNPPSIGGPEPTPLTVRYYMVLEAPPAPEGSGDDSGVSS
ncbi:MAG: type IV pilus assembly protein PilM [Planctomycetota bacterium]